LKIIIIYLCAWLSMLAVLWSFDLRGLLPSWFVQYRLAYLCFIIGSLGGTVYCLRAVYLNRCVKEDWNNNWTVWYLLRPLVSGLVGAIAYVFLKAGLLVLDAGSSDQSSSYGFLALSFIAGLNVDRFLVKLEDVAQVSWGVKPSRTSERSTNKREDDDETQNS